MNSRDQLLLTCSNYLVVSLGQLAVLTRELYKPGTCPMTRPSDPELSTPPELLDAAKTVNLSCRNMLAALARETNINNETQKGSPPSTQEKHDG